MKDNNHIGMKRHIKLYGLGNDQTNLEGTWQLNRINLAGSTHRPSPVLHGYHQSHRWRRWLPQPSSSFCWCSKLSTHSPWRPEKKRKNQSSQLMSKERPTSLNHSQQNLFGEYLDDAGVIAIARTRWWRGKLEKNAREAIWIIQAIWECTVPDEFAILQTKKDRLYGGKSTKKPWKNKWDDGFKALKTYPFVRFNQIHSHRTHSHLDFQVTRTEPWCHARSSSFFDLATEERSAVVNDKKKLEKTNGKCNYRRLPIIRSSPTAF